MRASSLYRLTAACLLTHALDMLLVSGAWTDSPVYVAPASLDQQILMGLLAPVMLGMLLYAEFSRRASMRFGICLFAVAYAGLHWFYRDQPVYDFASLASWVLILLAGIFGAAYLVPAKAR